MEKSDTDEVRQLTQDKPLAQKLFGSIIKSTTGLIPDTTIDYMMENFPDIVRQDDISIVRQNVICLFKDLEKLGLGTYIIGRRGSKTRFKWSVSGLDLKTICNATEIAGGDSTAVDNNEPPKEASFSPVTHRYRLRRPDGYVTFDLPDDLTVAEAERLASFIKTLPVEEAEGAN